jgi:hypothetical protein
VKAAGQCKYAGSPTVETTMGQTKNRSRTRCSNYCSFHTGICTPESPHILRPVLTRISHHHCGHRPNPVCLNVAATADLRRICTTKQPTQMLFPFLSTIYLLLALLSSRIRDVHADVYPDSVAAKLMRGNCGTIQNAFRMGELLRNDTETCHRLRWPAVGYGVLYGCTCSFYG